MATSGIINRICKRNTDDDETDELTPEHRQQAMGILATSDEIRGWFDDDEIERFSIGVSTDQLSQMKDAEWFDTVGHEGRDAIRFFRRHSDQSELYISILDTDEQFEVSVSAMTVTDITNDTIEAFCREFGRSPAANFDPLGERHDEPRMVVQPW